MRIFGRGLEQWQCRDVDASERRPGGLLGGGGDKSGHDHDEGHGQPDDISGNGGNQHDGTSGLEPRAGFVAEQVFWFIPPGAIFWPISATRARASLQSIWRDTQTKGAAVASGPFPGSLCADRGAFRTLNVAMQTERGVGGTAGSVRISFSNNEQSADRFLRRVGWYFNPSGG